MIVCWLEEILISKCCSITFALFQLINSSNSQHFSADMRVCISKCQLTIFYYMHLRVCVHMCI